MSEVMIELEPQQILASRVIVDWVERGTGGQGAVVSYWAGGVEHKITYADIPAAIQAVDDWLEAANAPPDPAGTLAPGDDVLVSHHTHARGALGEQVPGVLLAFPTTGFPFWVIVVQNATLYMDNITVSKVNP